jgi:hypothetical protein
MRWETREHVRARARVCSFGSFLLAGSDDGSISVWNVDNVSARSALRYLIDMCVGAVAADASGRCGWIRWWRAMHCDQSHNTV